MSKLLRTKKTAHAERRRRTETPIHDKTLTATA